MTVWTNWAGNQQATGIDVATPHSVEELADIVSKATADGRGVRPVGTGHSFSSIGSPRDVQVRLDHLSGIVRADAKAGLIEVRGGTTLNALNSALASLGMAMTNLGDIDEQTVAGAMATGTHGTGARFGGLATQVEAFNLMTADGNMRMCSPSSNPDIFEMGRVGLGALGIVTSLMLRTEPLFALNAREGGAELDEIVASFDAHADATDHFEFYWFPHTTRVLTKHNTRLPASTKLNPLPKWRSWWDDEFLSNTVLGAVTGTGRRMPSLVRPLAKVAGNALAPREYTDLSHRVFTSPRRVKFVEMEYAVPRVEGMAVLSELRKRVERSNWNIAVPVEVRIAAADDIPMSTAYERDNVYIAIHTPPGAPDQRAYFDAFESIAVAAGGRPHWGKMHNLDADKLRDLYPRFDEFTALRDQLDPTRTFTNDYLDRVLG